MKHLALIAALAVLPGLVAAQKGSAPAGLARETERFELWTGCRPLRFSFSMSNENDLMIGSTAEHAESLVRSRLRAARIYSDWTAPPKRDWADIEMSAVPPMLLVRGHATSKGWGAVYLDLSKPLTDPASGVTRFATTWRASNDPPLLFGHASGPSFLEALSIGTDKFIDEYLRVNADAC